MLNMGTKKQTRLCAVSKRLQVKRMVMIMIVLVAGVLCGPDILFGQMGGEYGSDMGRFLEAERVYVFSPSVSGIVEEIRCERGEYVSKGDVLVQLDAKRVALQVEYLESQLEMNQAIGRREAEIRMDYSRDNLRIVNELYDQKIGGQRVSSEKEMKEATQSKELAELAIKKIEYERRLLDLERRQNVKLLEDHTVRAPVDGVIVGLSSVKVLEGRNLKRPEVGELVQAGSVVTAMMKVDRLRVRQDLSKEMINQVQPGQRAQVYVEGQSEPVEAEVVYISPTIVPEVGLFHVEVEFANPPAEVKNQAAGKGGYPYRFRPGLRARVELVD